jgi:hypothetical protein
MRGKTTWKTRYTCKDKIETDLKERGCKEEEEEDWFHLAQDRV